MSNQAMIFAAGMGTRLKPLTDVLPKALVPVGSKPLLQHVAEKLIASGVESIVVNVHHHAGQIENFVSLLRAVHPDIRFSISDESQALLETGGGIRKAAPLFDADSPVLIHNCDILSNADLSDLLTKSQGTDATLLVSSRKTQRYLVFDDDMRLVGWTNIATGEVKSPYPEVIAELSTFHSPLSTLHFRLYAFSGIHAISPALIEAMEDWPDRFPIMDFYLNHCATHNIRGIVKDDLQLLDVGKLDTLAQAEEWRCL